MLKVEVPLTHEAEIAWIICNNKVRNKLGNYIRQKLVLNTEFIDELQTPIILEYNELNA